MLGQNKDTEGLFKYRNGVSGTIPVALDSLLISADNLKTYIQQDRLKDFSAFLFLKKKYFGSKSIFYEFTTDALAADIGMCRNTASFLVKRFIDYGWCRIHRGRKGRYKNLLFISPRKWSDFKENDLLIKFNIEGDAKQIQDDLYALILKNKQNQFDWTKKLGRDIKTPANLKEHKKAIKVLKNKNYRVEGLPDQNAKFQVSIKKIAEWFNCSVGKASQIINRLKHKGKILVWYSKQIIAKVKGGKAVWATILANPGSFQCGDYVIKVSCNYYKF